MAPRNLDGLRRVYGPATWDVHERLDVSLDPAGPDSLLDDAGRYLAAGQVVLDAGCRDGAHLIALVRRFDIDGVGVDPVALHLERAGTAVRSAGLTDRIALHEGVMHDVPYPDGYFDFVWCRDVLEQVDDLAGALHEVVRVMKPDAPPTRGRHRRARTRHLRAHRGQPALGALPVPRQARTDRLRPARRVAGIGVTW